MREITTWKRARGRTGPPVRAVAMTAAAALLLVGCAEDEPDDLADDPEVEDTEPDEEMDEDTDAEPDEEMDEGEDAENGEAGETVDIADNEFEPGEIEVAAGDTVEWEHVGDADHTVTFDDEDSGDLSSGDTFSRTFDEPGDYDYVCEIHPTMQGTVVVAE